MTEFEAIQYFAHHQARLEQAQKAISMGQLAYIKANAPYPVGSIVEVEDKGEIKNLKIKAYIVEQDLSLKPVFET